MTETELEIFRLRVRVMLLEKLLLATAISLPAFPWAADIARNRAGLEQFLEKATSSADQAYLKLVGGAEGAMQADEVQEIASDLKRQLGELASFFQPKK